MSDTMRTEKIKDLTGNPSSYYSTLIFGAAGAILGALVLDVILAIPLFFLWNWAAPYYFPFIPSYWQSIPFWDVVALTFLFAFVRHVLFGSLSKSSS